MHLVVCLHNLHFNLIINPFKHKCKMCQVFTHSFFLNHDDCKMEFVSYGINRFKMIQFMCKC